MRPYEYHRLHFGDASDAVFEIGISRNHKTDGFDSSMDNDIARNRIEKPQPTSLRLQAAQQTACEKA